MQESRFDECNGRMKPCLAQYHGPVHMDVPEIDLIWTAGVGAAVANAIYNVTGRRVRNLPIARDKLM